ncbi:MAG: ATP-binding protein, partial [Limisphaerales bacterium]
MSASILTVDLRFEPDVVLARQRAAQLGDLLGYNRQDQVRIATAVSEIARNAIQYAGRSKAEYYITKQREFCIRISDRGRGITNLEDVLEGRSVSRKATGLGITGVRRLLPIFEISSTPQGTTVIMGKSLPPMCPVDSDKMADLARELAQETPRSPLEEIQKQNRELIAALEEVERSRVELRQLNRELEDTNRGVVALYAELEEKAEYLRRASDLKTRFLSNMTHEFRTPVNSIMSLCRILLDRLDGDLTSEQEKQVQFIQKAATDLSALVNDLLDLAKVEAGKTTVQAEDFEVAELFATLRGTLRPLLSHSTSIQLVFEEPHNLPTLHTDRVKVSQILRNLISNSLKFTERGEVRVRAVAESGQKISFLVSDTGVGIAPEHQERIFEEFVQLEGAHQKFRGTGLGLPITKKLTELLGGRISVDSKPRLGASFCVTIPTSYCERGRSSEPGVLRSMDPLRFPVLVIDETAETLFSYDKLLKGTSFQVIPARTLRDAREAIVEARLFAIVLELSTNDEKLWGYVRELKNNPAAQQIPLFIVSEEINRERAFALGADDFCPQPVEGPWLKEKLEQVALSLEKPTLLLVDDEEAARYILRDLFRQTRFRVVEASSGEEALAKAKEINPAAIFMDVSMPGQNGIETAKKLRADLVTQKIPIIIHT